MDISGINCKDVSRLSIFAEIRMFFSMVLTAFKPELLVLQGTLNWRIGKRIGVVEKGITTGGKHFHSHLRD